jgi:hypothetical protein
MEIAHFTYKLFIVFLNDYGGYQSILIIPNYVEIVGICKEIANNNLIKKRTNSSRIINIFEIDEETKAIEQAENQIKNYHSSLPSISVEKRYWFGDKIEKCKNDAIEYIDNNLGNGIDYVRKNKIFPSLNVFFILNF